MHFRNFIRHNMPLVEMTMSKPQMRLPITHELADLISLVHGQTLRARALSWLLSTGLMEASMKREELCKKVNEAIKGNISQNITKPHVPQSKLSTGQQIVGEVRSDNSFGMYNIEKDPNRKIDPRDLFSPVARKRIPELETILIGGLTIDDYYKKYYEPKKMSINSSEASGGRGKIVDYNLEEMRDFCEKKFGSSFYYGGVNGYLQFVEKGDGYMAAVNIRDYNNDNEQYGYDLRPEYKNITSDEYEIHKDILGWNKKKTTVFNFAGGPISPDEKRAREAVEQMEIKFREITHDLKNKKELDSQDVPQDRQEFLKKNLINTQSFLKDLVYTVEDQGVGRGAYHTRFNIPSYNSKKGVRIIPKYIDMDFLEKMIWAGLNEEMKGRDPRKYTNLEKFGEEWDGSGSPPSIEKGYYRFDEKGKLNFRLPMAIREKAWEIITSPQEENERALNVNFPFHLLMPDVIKSNDKTNPGKKNSNLMLNISSLFNAAMENKNIFNIFKDMKINSYHATDVDPNIYTQKQTFDKFPLDHQSRKVDGKLIYSVDNDKFIKELLNSGYTWELKGPKEKMTGSPDWHARKWAIISLPKVSQYRVVKEPGNVFYLYVPSGESGESFAPKGYSHAGKTWLAGGKGVEFHGGLGGGHVNWIPASKSHTENLIERLKNGEFGEGDPPIKSLKPNLPIYDETELPSVLAGVINAKNYFKTHKGKGKEDRIDRDFPDDLLKSFGSQALRGFAGDPAFQVGYLTLQEIKEFLKTDFHKEYDKEIVEDLGLDSKKGGRGINALLHRVGPRLDSELGKDLQEEVIGDLLKQITSKKPIIHWSPKQGSLLADPEMAEYIEPIRQAIGVNAFYARVRSIRNFVLDRMNEIDKKNEKSSSLTTKSDDGGDTQYDASGKGFEYDDRTELERKVVDPKSLFSLAGKEFGKTISRPTKVLSPQLNQKLSPRNLKNNLPATANYNISQGRGLLDLIQTIKGNQSSSGGGNIPRLNQGNGLLDLIQTIKSNQLPSSSGNIPQLNQEKGLLDLIQTIKSNQSSSGDKNALNRMN